MARYLVKQDKESSKIYLWSTIVDHAVFWWDSKEELLSEKFSSLAYCFNNMNYKELETALTRVENSGTSCRRGTDKYGQALFTQDGRLKRDLLDEYMGYLDIGQRDLAVKLLEPFESEASK